MNLKKLTTLLFAGVTAATPLVTSAQNPTILQGNYVSNVFGQANFVLNPNAQTNVANVNVTNATRTRSTTTPLVATSEFNVTITAPNGTVVWNLRPFDEGMKNQNCEARFTYRGFQATSKVQITRSGAPVGELVLTPSATDPRIASINFPCGDFSIATKFLVTDTATLSGTNEIGGIYVGLATNQANVAQAESVLNALHGVAQNIPSNVTTDIIYDTVNSDRYGSYNSSTGVYTVRKSGTYLINAKATMTSGTINVGNYIELKAFLNTTQACRSYENAPYTGFYPIQKQIGCQIEANAGDTIKIAIQFAFSARDTIAQEGYTDLQISRFPSSSELVVTPETQNVWGGVEYRTGSKTLYAGVAEPTGYGSGNFNDPAFNSPSSLRGVAQVTTTNSGNDLGFSIPNLPVGSYKLSISGAVTSNPGSTAGDTVLCTFRIQETTTATTIGESVYQGTRVTGGYNTVNAFQVIQGTFKNTSVATRNFRLEASKTVDSSSTNSSVCFATAAAAGNSDANIISFIIEPLDNASNSALYVQGPVKGSGTGAAIPAGYVGEEKLAYTAPSTFTTAADTPVVIPSASITLEPGVWDVSYKLAVGAYRAPPSTAAVFCRVRMLENGSLLADTESLISFHPGVSSAGNLVSSQSVTKRVLITSATKTYTVDLTANFPSTTAQCYVENGNVTSGISGDDSVSYIRAVRIN